MMKVLSFMQIISAMQKNKFKITPQVYKELVKISNSLPRAHRKDRNGNLMYRNISRLVKVSEINETKTVEGKPIDPNTNYVQKGKEAILVNHQVNLIEVYKNDGMSGVDEYVHFFNQLAKNEDNTTAPIEEPATKG